MSYLDLMEEDLVPYAVAADDAAAHLGSFSLGCKVQQPAFHRGVGLTEDLNTVMTISLYNDNNSHRRALRSRKIRTYVHRFEVIVM